MIIIHERICMKKDKKSGMEIVVIFLSIVITLLIGYIVYDKIFSNNMKNDDDSLLIDLSDYDMFLNYDGTYGDIKSIELGDQNISYSLNLTVDGKVYSDIFGEKNFIKNVSNVRDIVVFGNNSIMDDMKCYMLLDDGNVYVYKVSLLFEKKYEAIKIDGISNVSRLIERHYFPLENSNIVSDLVAILDNGELVLIK